MTTDLTTDVAAVAARLRDGNAALRTGERPDWDREAALLVAAASPDDPTRSLEELLRHRLNGIPLGYLVGHETFLTDDFEVETGVVVPHPATELLAMLAVHATDLYAAGTDVPRLLEVGVGVGVVAVSVMKRRPAVEAHASELIGAALRLTRANARRILGDGHERLSLYQAFETDDVFSPFEARPVRGADVVVANPPYLVEGDEVSESVKKSGVAHFSFAPENDPSWFLRRVVDAPEGLLSESCSVLMECAEFYLPDHESVMIEAGWEVEVFDREEYVFRFGAHRDMREMDPSPHRVLHAWRGAGAELGV